MDDDYWSLSNEDVAFYEDLFMQKYPDEVDDEVMVDGEVEGFEKYYDELLGELL